MQQLGELWRRLLFIFRRRQFERDLEEEMQFHPLAMVLGQGIALTAAGVAIGLAGAWASTRVLETLLFGIRPSDGIAFACGSGVLVLTVLIASLIPARRATKVDPLASLRCE